jgi:recombinational DNA repair ATPase RecF
MFLGLQVVCRANRHLGLVCLLRPRNPHTCSQADRDDSFNSITGLNGSGKSNILDAICFVLGITNLGVVRAQNLQVGAIEGRRACMLQALTDVCRTSSTSAVKPASPKPA